MLYAGCPNKESKKECRRSAGTGRHNTTLGKQVRGLRRMVMFMTCPSHTRLQVFLFFKGPPWLYTVQCLYSCIGCGREKSPWHATPNRCSQRVAVRTVWRDCSSCSVLQYWVVMGRKYTVTRCVRVCVCASVYLYASVCHCRCALVRPVLSCANDTRYDFSGVTVYIIVTPPLTHTPNNFNLLCLILDPELTLCSYLCDLNM